MKSLKHNSCSLDRIANCLDRIATALEHARMTSTIVNVKEGNGSTTEIAQHDAIIKENYQANGERATAAQEVGCIDNTTTEGNTDSFNTNSDTAIKSLTSAIKTHAE